MELTEEIRTKEDLARTYTPGVAGPARDIAANPERVWEYTGRGNRVAIISDGSSVLGLGAAGPAAALPIMEGKAAILKAFADVDAFPMVLNTESPQEIIDTVRAIAPSFGAIFLEDIAAPQCFAIESTLIDLLDIPVFHDDQHGTAIVVLAGLMNAWMVRGRMDTKPLCTFRDAKVVISGAGAAGTAITKMLLHHEFTDIVVTDSRGVICTQREDLSGHKLDIAKTTNPRNICCTLTDAMKDADVFIGVSRSGVVTKEMVQSMTKNPIVFALANPTPEIMPEEAFSAGAAIVASGRSDFPNQVNNMLAFPGIMRAALDMHAPKITCAMKDAAARALADLVPNPTADHILPDPFSKDVVAAIVKAVMESV